MREEERSSKVPVQGNIAVQIRVKCASPKNCLRQLLHESVCIILNEHGVERESYVSSFYLCMANTALFPATAQLCYPSIDVVTSC